MKTISHDVSNEIVINKSRFITNIYKIKSIEDAKDKISLINQKYPDATHHCYAYVYSGYKKASDDGEPSGTASLPILKVIESNELENILCIVTRYFGGIKLGAGGLVRAYTTSITSALDKVDITDLRRQIIINILFIYENIKTIDFLLKDYEIIQKDFDTTITYKVLLPYDEYINIKDKLSNISDITEQDIFFA